jgi:hypothetical protein
MYGMKWGHLVAWAGDIGQIGDEWSEFIGFLSSWQALAMVYVCWKW